MRRRDTRDGPGALLYALGDANRQPPKAFNPNLDETVAKLQLTKAIVLTHSCEMDNSPKATLTLGLIRPMRTYPEEGQDAIREGRNVRLLYLPANDAPELEESYVDLSRLTSLRRNVLPEENRVLSASDQLLKALYMGLMKYFTRFEVDEASIVPLVEQALAE